LCAQVCYNGGSFVVVESVVSSSVIAQATDDTLTCEAAASVPTHPSAALSSPASIVDDDVASKLNVASHL